MVSLPLPATMTSGPEVPTMVSSPGVPRIVAGWPAHSSDVGVAFGGSGLEGPGVPCSPGDPFPGCSVVGGPMVGGVVVGGVVVGGGFVDGAGVVSVVAGLVGGLV